MSRTFSLISALLGALLLAAPRGGLLRVLLYLPKVAAETASFYSALAGLAGGLWSLLRRKPLFAALGLLGAGLNAGHIARIANGNSGFERAFGVDWEQRIPEQQRARLLPRRWSPAISPAPEAEWKRDLTLHEQPDSGKPLLADLWQPPAGMPRSRLGVIYLHGSGWVYADKDFRTRPLFRRLVWQGHTVLDVAYTLAPKAGLIEMLADVKRAVAWIKDHSAELGLRPDRIVLMGGSAGGHLALLAAYTPNHAQLDPPDLGADSSVRGVVSFYGLPDLVQSYRHFKQDFPGLPDRHSAVGRLVIPWWEEISRRRGLFSPEMRYVAPAEMVPTLMGCTPEENPELYRLGSAISHVGPHCPPTLLIQGAHDMAGMAPAVRRLHASLCQAGVRSILLELPHTEHAFDLMSPRISPSTQAALYDTERFLALLA